MNENESDRSATGPEVSPQKSMPSVLRWALVALAAFGVGMLLITFALYVPTWRKLEKTNADLIRAESTLTGKTGQIATLQADTESLQNDLETAMLHMDLLQALSGVRGANLAAAADDYAGARLSLIKATAALDALSGQLGTEQSDVLAAVQQSAAQALTDMQTDLKSAQPELDQLAQNLGQLEENLFPNP
jgi:chromosome segregation ATPase